MQTQNDKNTATSQMTSPLRTRYQPRMVHVVVLSMVMSIGLLIASVVGTPFSTPIKVDQGFATSAVVLGALALVAYLLLCLRDPMRRMAFAENQLQAAIDSISEGFVIYDEDERLVMCNQRYREIYPDIAHLFEPGVKFSDLAQAMIDVGMAPESIDAPSLWQQQRIQQFRQEEGEFITQYSDGRWVLLRDRKLPDGGSVGIRTEITDIKKREQDLIDSERRHRDLVERAPVAIYVHRNQIILYANKATADILGYDSPHLLLGKSIFDLIHPDHHRLAEQRLQKINAEDVSLPQVDMKFRRADGSTIYTEAQVSQVEFDGEPALESILRNITARRRTEHALMESELRYRTLFELAPDAMLVHDGETILFANAAAAAVFGAPDERKLKDVPLSSLLADETRRALFAPPTTPAYDNLDAHTLQEVRFQRLNAEPFDAEVVTTPTNYQGEVVHHTVVRDVTERKQMDAAMAQNAKLASLGGMAAGLAHELSQPLNILRFSAEGGLLKMNRGTADDALHAKNYTLIQDQAERMGAVMDSMRIFSRKDPGPMTPFDVALSVRDIVHMLRNPFRVDGVKIDVQGTLSGVTVLGNHIQLEQVLLNLLQNARDSIVEANKDGGGCIEIACTPRPQQNDALITISDSGGGIAPGDLKHIFDPFFTTKDVGKGTGLGLSLSHEIITSMSGRLSAENHADGARFLITLPLSTDNPITAPAHHTEIEALAKPDIANQPQARLNDCHVLVVEDEVEAARALADYLSDEGFHVTAVNDGQAGLEAYREFLPDIVITDIRMPGFSGTELIQALRNLDAHLPIIAMTGHMGETESINTGPGLEPVDVLKKPVSLMELSRKIETICTA